MPPFCAGAVDATHDGTAVGKSPDAAVSVRAMPDGASRHAHVDAVWRLLRQQAMPEGEMARLPLHGVERTEPSVRPRRLRASPPHYPRSGEVWQARTTGILVTVEWSTWSEVGYRWDGRRYRQRLTEFMAAYEPPR